MNLCMRIALIGAIVSLVGVAQVSAGGAPDVEEVAPGVPRAETLIIDQIFRFPDAENYNFWIPGTSTPTRQILTHETLWYIDQQTGEWINGVAAEPPEYNDDYTQMTVRTREGITWSDGEPITAHDVVFTTETLRDNEGMIWGAEFRRYVDDVYATDDHTLVFELSRPNSRFHMIWTSEYNATYVMPKHVWEDVDDPLSYRFWPPVSAGQYVSRDVDTDGGWHLFERREDWQDTVVAQVTDNREPPPYVLLDYPGPYEQYVLAMAEHDLDLFMEVTPEAFEALMDRSDTARSWYPDFPWVWQDELAGRGLVPNHEDPLYQEKDVRWALALTLDMFELQTDYLAGMPRVAALPLPPVPFHLENFYEPLQPWLEQLEIEVEDGEYFQVYDPDLPDRIYEWTIDEGHEVEGEPTEVFGYGWYRHAPDVAERLLEKHGFSRAGDGSWLTPDGDPWVIEIPIAPDEPAQYNLTLGAQDMWEDFGIEVRVITLEREPYYTRQELGDFDVMSPWGDAAAMGAAADRDRWPYIQQFHSDFYVEVGEISTGNHGRFTSDNLDRIIDELGEVPPDSDEAYEGSKEFLRYMVEEMYVIPAIGFTKFVTQDYGVYWEGFPTSENPYHQPAFWFMGGKFVLPYLEPAQ